MAEYSTRDRSKLFRSGLVDTPDIKDAAVTLAKLGSDITTDGITEGSTNLYYSDALARAAISTFDNGGDGAIAYDSATGVLSYTGPSPAEVRSHFSAGDNIDITDGVISIPQSITINSVSFDTTYVSTGTEPIGTLSWNTIDETLDLVVAPGVIYQISQEEGIVARNLSGYQLVNGTVVRITGASGNKATVDLADSSTEGASSATFGVVTQNIPNNSTGRVTTTGLVRGLDTSAFAEGVAIWLGANGQFTDVKPVAPLHLVHIGWVVRVHATEGMILVKISNGWELNELHDVYINNITDGQFIRYNAANSRWENMDIVTGTGVTFDAGVIAIGQDVSTTANVTFADISATGDLTVDGNLTVNGTTTTISATNLAVEDNMIYLNEGSTITNPDLGWAGNYNDGTYKHAGVFRDATDGVFKFYDSYTTEPGIEINVADASFAYAPVRTGALTATSGTFSGAVSASGGFTGTLTGSASSLTTARTISLTGDATGNVSFDGSTNVSLSTSIAVGGSMNGPLSNLTVKYQPSAPTSPSQGQIYFDSLNQKMMVYTGSSWVDAVPAGTGTGGGGTTTDAVATMRKYQYTTVSATNAISGTDDNGEILSYIVDGSQNVEVFVNGIKQFEGASADYVATTGSAVTFTYNLPIGTVVDIQVYELLTQDAFYLKSETYTKTETNSQISTAVSSYLPLTGGTLTGNLAVASLTSPSYISVGSLVVNDPGSNYYIWNNRIGDKTVIAKSGIGTGTISFEDESSNAHLVLAGTDARARLQFGTYNNNSYAGWIQASYDNTPGGTGNTGIEPLALNPQGGQVMIGSSTTFATTSVPLYVKGGTSGWSVFERNNKRLYVNANYSDTNTAGQLTMQAADNMALSLSARENLSDLYLTTSGLVGIGTTSPQSALDVNGVVKERVGGDGYISVDPSNAGVFGYYNWGIEIGSTASVYKGIFINGGRYKYFELEANVRGSSGANHQGMFWGNTSVTEVISGSSTGYKTTHQSSTAFHIRTINGNGNVSTINPNFDPNDGLWHHQKISATPDGYVRIWLDGVLVFEVTGVIPTSAGYVGFINYAGTAQYNNISFRSLHSDTVVSAGKLIANGTTWSNTTGGDIIVQNSSSVGAAVTLRPTSSTRPNGWSLYAGSSTASIGDGAVGFWDHDATSAQHRFYIDSSGAVHTPVQPGCMIACQAADINWNAGSIIQYGTTSGGGSTKLWDTTNSYDMTNSRYNVPSAGKYYVSFTCNGVYTSGSRMRVYPRINGSTIASGLHARGCSSITGDLDQRTFSGILNLAKNDYVDVYVGEGTADTFGANYFTIMKVI